MQDVVLGEAVAEVPAPELLEGVAQPQTAAEGAVVVLQELPLRAKEVESGGERAIEEPGLGEAQLSLLDVGARADLDGGKPAAAQEVVLREIDGAEDAVRRGEAAADREEAGRPLRHVDVDDDLRLVGPGRRVHLDLFEVAEVGEALLAALQLPQRENLALGHLQLAAQDLVLAADVARDVDPLDVDGRSLVDLEQDGDLALGLDVELGIHLGRCAADIRVQVLDGLDGIAQRAAREHVAGLELHLPADLAFRDQRHPREAYRRHVVLRALHHDDVDGDARLLAVHRHVMRLDASLDVAVIVVEL